MNGDSKVEIFKFLEANGWECKENGGGYDSFFKEGSVGFDVDVGCSEIVAIDDSGDFAHIPHNVYALIGFIQAKSLLVPVIPDGI